MDDVNHPAAESPNTIKTGDWSLTIECYGAEVSDEILVRIKPSNMKASLVFLLGILLTSFVYSQSTQPKFESLQKQFYTNYEQLKEQNKSFAEKEDEEEDGTLSRFRRWEW